MANFTRLWKSISVPICLLAAFTLNGSLASAATPSATAKGKTLVKGDLNQDGVFDRRDIAAFRQALYLFPTYQKNHPKLTNQDIITIGDFSGDGKFDRYDLSPFMISTFNKAVQDAKKSTTSTTSSLATAEAQKKAAEEAARLAAEKKAAEEEAARLAAQKAAEEAARLAATETPTQPPPTDTDGYPVPDVAPEQAQMTAPVLMPGNGFAGPTSEPLPVGTGPGSDAKAIARWDVVPYQTFNGQLNVGVVAFHINDIDRVEFSVNGGPWKAVTSMSLNPQTNVVEYWATLRAGDFPDGLLEVRAIAYPKVGVPRVLESMPLNSNSKGTLVQRIRYVSTTGSDTAGDGTQQKPFASIMKAARSIQDAQGGVNADGGTIYLLPGDHVYGTYSYGLLTKTENRWLTITPAPGVAKGAARLVRAGTFDGLRTKLVSLRGLTLAPANGQDQLMVVSQDSLTDFVWLDDCTLAGPGRTVDSSWVSGWTGVYATRCAVSNCRDGLSGNLLRDIVVKNIGSDAFSDGKLIVNCVVEGINGNDTTFHSDVYQLYSSADITLENRIVYGLMARAETGQGLFAGAKVSIKDIAFVNCYVNNQLQPNVARAFQFCGPTENMYVKNCTIVGPSNWRTDMGFTAKNVVVEDCSFTGNPPYLPTPWDVPGVTYRPPPPLYD